MDVPTVQPSDRLALTICFAIVVHAIVILGVTFAPPKRFDSSQVPLEILLVHESSKKAPPKAEFLAQVSAEGGAEQVHDQKRAATPLTAPFPDNRAEIAAIPKPVPPMQNSGAPDDAKAAPAATASVERYAGEASQKREAARPQIAVPTPKSEKPRAELATKPKPEPAEKVVEQPRAATVTNPQVPNPATLMMNSFALASLNAEIDQRLEARAKRPRRKFISMSTREYRFAAYMEAWRAKVERIGNLNYPDEARRKHLAGSLLLDVALRPNGSVADITIRRPSGVKALDDAAIRIVHLSAPFAPFPDDISKDIDILHITRTWQFVQGDRFASQ
jgi:protein TonB